MIVAFCATYSEAAYIIRGRDAKVGEFPWQGSLQRRGLQASIDTFPGHTCGCALISDTWVITAAHCVGAGPFGLYVIMGLHKRGDKSVGEPADYIIEDITIHPEWTGRVETTDAALIKLVDPVKMNKYVQPIELAENSDDFDGKTCTITGWGIVTEGGTSLPITLQAVDVPVMPTEMCQRFFYIVNEGHICVGGEGAGGSCNGDSGGPLVCQGKLAGVTSFGIQGCHTAFPSVYTRMGFVRDWIRKVSGV